MKRILCCLLPLLLVLPLCLTACSPGQGADSEVLRQKSQVEDSVLSSQASALESSLPDESAVSSSAEGSPEQEMSEREKNWRGDFSYFKRHYVRYHPDPFYYLSEEEFDFQVEQLAKKVDRLSDSDIFFELSTIVASLGDNHTHLDFPESFYAEVLPIGIACYDGKVYLSRYYEPYSQFEPFLLHEIVSVNGVDIKYIQAKAQSAFDPRNAWVSTEPFGRYFWTTAFLDWAGCGYADGYTIGLLDDDQRVVSVEAPVVSSEETVGNWIRPEHWYDLPYHSNETYAHYFETEKGSYVYLFFCNEVSPDGGFYHDLMNEVSSLLKEHPGSKLVIDLRNNTGGRQTSVDRMVEDIPLLKEAYQPETYILTGPYTASSAISILLNFKRELDAVQVGEPTGQFTKLWAYYNSSSMVNLPLSQITCNIASWRVEYTTENTYYDAEGKLYEWENAVLPDVYVSMDVEDVKEGKDTVIEWILEH